MKAEDKNKLILKVLKECPMTVQELSAITGIKEDLVRARVYNLKKKVTDLKPVDWIKTRSTQVPVWGLTDQPAMQKPSQLEAIQKIIKANSKIRKPIYRLTEFDRWMRGVVR